MKLLFRSVMVHLDAKMEKFKEELKLKLTDTSASFEEQSKLIKYLKVGLCLPICFKLLLLHL